MGIIFLEKEKTETFEPLNQMDIETIWNKLAFKNTVCRKNEGSTDAVCQAYKTESLRGIFLILM